MTLKRRKPANTTHQVHEDPLGFLLNASSRGRSFVGSDTLPAVIDGYGDYSGKAVLKAAGVKFLGIVEDDPIFQYVELPQGWKKVPRNHSMWSDLVDNRGRKRASIFYKAASYDRGAHMLLSTRFGVQEDYNRRDEKGVAVAHVTDGGRVIHTTEPIRLPADDRRKHEVADQAGKAGVAWLDKNHPNWRDPGAYWG